MSQTGETSAAPAAPKRSIWSRLYNGETTFDFVGRRRIGFTLSLVLILATAVSLGVRGLNLGIDFEGGVSWEVASANVSQGDVEGVLSKNGIEVGDALYTVLPKYSVPENGDWAISCGTAFTGRVRITVHPSVLVGKRIVSVSGLKEGSETVEIVTDGGTAKIGHERKCCEHIGLMDHTGEAKDLVGRVIRSAEVVFGGAGEDETFYEIKTDGSDLWLRFGDVNDDSRYGVEVDFAWEPV